MPTYLSKILIVDDQAANRLAIKYMLEKINIKIFEAASGKQALSLILKHDFAVILMDVVMPGLDGYETIRLIHSTERFQQIPIVMVTSYGTKEQYIKAYEAGAVDYVTKPVEPIVLTNKINQFVELSQQREAAQIAQREQAMVAASMEGLLNSAGEGILGINLTGEITFANPKACALLHARKEKLTQKNIQIFFTSAASQEINTEPDTEALSTNIFKLLRRKSSLTDTNERWMTVTGETFYVEYSCEIIRNNKGQQIGGVVTFQNISERKAIEDRLTRLANYDPLTNLANRAYFHDTLTKAMARSRRTDSKLVLLFLDLDHFKDINDNLGHDAGDLLLKIVSRRINQCIREGDVAARIGGDEFAVIIYDIDSLTGVVQIAEKIITTVNQPVDLFGTDITTSTSIGIAIFDDYKTNLDELVKAADISMYTAKTNGRNRYQFFKQKMQQRATKKSRIQVTLAQALDGNELSISYQPKISLKKSRVIGLEALIRWTNSNGEIIAPKDFIPVAEESGQIHALGEWVFERVCRQIKSWQDLPGFDGLSISINISALQLKAGGFHRQVEGILNKHEIEPGRLELELTETAIMSKPLITARELHFLHELGIGISIDDFGTGYTSLNYLKRFPIDALKIDQRFISAIGLDDRDEDVIKIVMAIGRTLGIDVIAEGVETNAQLAFLYSIDCDLVQGYFFSEPLDQQGTTKMLEAIGTTYSDRFDNFKRYINDNNLQPLHAGKLH